MRGGGRWLECRQLTWLLVVVVGVPPPYLGQLQVAAWGRQSGLGPGLVNTRQGDTALDTGPPCYNVISSYLQSCLALFFVLQSE